MSGQALFQFSDYPIDIYVIPPLATSLLVAGLAFFVLIKDLQKEPNRSFFRFGLCLSLWLFGYAFIAASPNEETASIWLRLAYAGVTFIPACSYESSIQITSRGMSPLAPRIRIAFLYAISAVFYLLIFFLPNTFFKGWRIYFWGRSPLYGPLGFLFVIYFAAAMTLSLAVCRQNFLRAKIAAYRNQIRYFSFAMSVGFLGGIDFLCKFGLPVYPIGYLPILVLFSILSYAIIRHNLMDIQTRIHKTLMWAGFSVLLLVPCIGVLIMLWPWLEKFPLWVVWLLGLILLGLTVLYFRAIHPVIDHLFQQGDYDPYEVSQKLPERFAVESVRRLKDEMAQILMETLSADLLALLILEEKGNRYLPTKTNKTDPDHYVTEDDPFIQWLSRHPGVIEARTFQDNAPDLQVKVTSKVYFIRSGAAVCIPLQTGSRLVGMVHIGEKIDREPLKQADIEFLERFRIEGNLALERLLVKSRGEVRK